MTKIKSGSKFAVGSVVIAKDSRMFEGGLLVKAVYPRKDDVAIYEGPVNGRKHEVCVFENHIRAASAKEAAEYRATAKTLAREAAKVAKTAPKKKVKAKTPARPAPKVVREVKKVSRDDAAKRMRETLKREVLAEMKGGRGLAKTAPKKAAKRKAS